MAVDFKGQSFGELTLTIIFLIGIVLGVVWLVWQLYLFVAGTFWPDQGALSNPNYFQFAAGWVLLCIISSVFRGGKKSE